MFDHVEWLCFIQTDSEDKAKKIYTKLRERLDSRVKFIGISRYWQDKTLFEVRFLQELKIDEVKDAIFKVLLYSQSVSNERYVVGPESAGEGKWFFEIIMPKTNIAGLKWATLSIKNFEQEE